MRSNRDVFCLLLLLAAGFDGTAHASGTRSISEWVSCTGTKDDTEGAIEAFAAAANDAFTLVVDCPVVLHSGLAIDRTIFIDNKTTVTFTGAGKFLVDNLFHPAFVIANSTHITLTGWNVVWEGSVPVNPDVGGYLLAGKLVKMAGSLQPAGPFNDITLTGWLQTHRNVLFNEEHGFVKAVWVGGVNLSAVFYITGNSNNLVFSGMSVSVPATVGANNFMPMAFSLSENWVSDQTVTAETPRSAKYAGVPHELTFSGITLDGTLMGWQGSVQDSMFENITSKRYSDLQDAHGDSVGGIDLWFPPPHLFYFDHTLTGDPTLYNSNVHFDTVNDVGPRLGVARDASSSAGGSGYAASLKLGCSYCSVDNYTSKRPDGFLDLLPSTDLTVSNVVATFDSAFIHDFFPSGVRFPAATGYPPGYTNVTFENVQMTDTAASTAAGPIGSATSSSNVAMVFKNVHVTLNRWADSQLPIPTVGGDGNDVALTFSMTTQSTQVSYLLHHGVSTTLEESPLTVAKGTADVQLTWESRGARTCSAAGEWSGSVGVKGSRVVKVAAADAYEFGLTCQSSSDSAPTSLQVTTNQ
jgi:hypothetical protein